jgi:ParB-like chromosome segregation protein Spo0J
MCGMNRATDNERLVAIAELDERLARYRLSQSVSEAQIAKSLKQYGQLSPIIVSATGERELMLIDGFKRLRAARQLKGFTHLQARMLEVDQASAKAAMFHLNQFAGRPQQLEEAWIVHSLVREDGLSQADAARLLGRHKSWVHRRLALLEQLAPEAVEQLRLGLLSVSLARQLVRLPMGNQQEALRSATQASLTSVELRGVVDLLLSSSTEQQRRLVLDEPRRALRQASDTYVHQWDARLSVAGNRAARRLGQLLESLARMDAWLRHRGRSELAACDRQPLSEGFQRLIVDSRRAAEAAADFLAELKLPD